MNIRHRLLLGLALLVALAGCATGGETTAPRNVGSTGAERAEPHADDPGHHGARALLSARARRLLHRPRPRPLHAAPGRVRGARGRI